ncbi:NAD(P)-binding domain-containing protein [Gibbsiella quercinecans]|uniref:NAD(P)-binding domain-containing protein n=1 Tax=Gibbsiella quercinecans TaxID=929813 RepID=UPI000EF135C2|nr:NAD(P)/FAD-dependent oxidoreductase [Gibbsiella quercinecans]RLM04090.1 FAD-dependent oxidoreductase [Gibbsiella quercinecans]
MSSHHTTLKALEQRLADDLSLLELPAKPWIPPRHYQQHAVHDVIIIGAGMCGLTAAASLRFLGVDNLLCLDKSPAGLEGPWLKFARMETLRSPKQLTGPALGLPALTFRAWYQAQFGNAAWEALGKIPRTQWMDYLAWYRKVLQLPVVNQIEVTDIQSIEPGLFALHTQDLANGGTQIYYARRVVLANGRDGLGGPYVPGIARSVDQRFWAHSADDIDFTQLAGKHIAVIGAGASAMDNAATALELGAAQVDLFIRRGDIPRINKFTGIASQGVVHGFQALDDRWKWKFLHHTLAAQTPPPRDSTLRVSRHPNGRFWLNSPVLSLKQQGERVLLATPSGTHELDFVIFATGFRVDLAQKPELARFASAIKFWQDAFTPPAGEEQGELATSPYLGDDFSFQEKQPGQCPALHRIYCFNYPSTLSHGKLSGDIPAVSEGARRLAQGIVRSIFVEDRETHFANLVAFDTPELLGDEWQDANHE